MQEGFAAITPDSQRIQFEKALKMKQEISDLNAHITDALLTGDVIFNSGNGNVHISTEMKQLGNQLTMQAATLEADVHKKGQIRDTHNRDFVDHIEPANEGPIISLEDYTVFMVVMSYIFVICIAVYTYTYQSENPMRAFVKAMGFAILTSIVMGMLFYNLA